MRLDRPRNRLRFQEDYFIVGIVPEPLRNLHYFFIPSWENRGRWGYFEFLSHAFHFSQEWIAVSPLLMIPPFQGHLYILLHHVSDTKLSKKVRVNLKTGLQEVWDNQHIIKTWMDKDAISIYSLSYNFYGYVDVHIFCHISSLIGTTKT